jgi:threonine/homoserine/homoserine lactone efflux protein
MDSFLAFLGISILVIVTPGPDTAITIRNTLLGGRSAGLATALGVALGQAVWALCTSLGLVALLVASEPVFLALKYAGAAYLLFLGAQALLAAWRGAPIRADNAPASRRRLAPVAALRQGLLSDLSNPKMAAFFVSLLPQFAGADQASLQGLLALGLIFATMTFCWLAAYALVLARMGRWLDRSAVRRAIDAITGAVLVALGLRTAIAGR